MTTAASPICSAARRSGPASTGSASTSTRAASSAAWPSTSASRTPRAATTCRSSGRHSPSRRIAARDPARHRGVGRAAAGCLCGADSAALRRRAALPGPTGGRPPPPGAPGPPPPRPPAPPPRLGAAPAGVSALSYAEQGYDRGVADLALELERLNAAYEARFGFRYCVFVAGRPRSALLPGFEAALAGERTAEIARALDAVVDIAQDRWHKLATPADAAHGGTR